jgi:DNA mismatch repair protein MutS
MIPREPHEFSSEGGAERLCGIHGVATLDGFGTFTRPMLAAACGLLAYLDHVGRGKLPLLLPPVARHGEAHMAMDEATRASLEILRSSTGGRSGSLIEAVDRCVTGAGARQLAEDLSAPLLDRAVIEERLELVQWLYDDALLREDLRGQLRSLPDAGALWAGGGGRGSRVIWGNCAMVWRARRGWRGVWRVWRIVRRCWMPCCLRWLGMIG